jgi:hypothetical protein
LGAASVKVGVRPEQPELEEIVMSTQGRSSTATRLVRPAFIAGVAVAGATFWMAATTGPNDVTAAPQVQLASMGSPMLSPHQWTAQPCCAAVSLIPKQAPRHQARCSPR